MTVVAALTLAAGSTARPTQVEDPGGSGGGTNCSQNANLVGAVLFLPLAPGPYYATTYTCGPCAEGYLVGPDSYYGSMFGSAVAFGDRAPGTYRVWTHDGCTI